MVYRRIFISQFAFQKFVNFSFLLLFISFFCFQPSLAKVDESEKIGREIGKKVERLLSDLISIANAGKSTDKKNIGIQQVLQRDCDMDRIAKDVLGESRWKQAKPDQRRAFTEAFTGYFAGKLKMVLVDLKGYKISLGKIQKDSEGYYVVSSFFKKAKNDTKSIELMVSKGRTTGVSRVFDLLVGGFSATSHENGKINDLFMESGKNLDVLIRNLGKK